MNTNVALVIPTGIGCSIGGHSGDASPVAKLMGACCDNLILHPNVTNAADINEMPDNALYVDGGMLDAFFGGRISLFPKKNNKILVVVNKPVLPEQINSVSAARVTLGADIEIMELDEPLVLTATMNDMGASGRVMGLSGLLTQVHDYKEDFDALAIHTKIDVSMDIRKNYCKNGGVNPWGGAEAYLCNRISQESLNKPAAHAPLESLTADESKDLNIVTDPRIAPEMVSVSYLHCVLKGLQRAPQPISGVCPGSIEVIELDFLVIPENCNGIPQRECRKRGIKIIAVRENTTIFKDGFADPDYVVDNYLEAAGVIMAAKAGIAPSSVRRPLSPTKVHRSES